MSNHDFDQVAWSKMSMFEQMGNIGSEVGRALAAKRQHNEKRMEASFYRGLDLIDATAGLWSGRKNGRLRELLRAREEFARSIVSDTTDATLEKYFMKFAVAARLNQS